MKKKFECYRCKKNKPILRALRSTEIFVQRETCNSPRSAQYIQERHWLVDAKICSKCRMLEKREDDLKYKTPKTSSRSTQQ